MSGPRKHHYLPEVYQKNFCAPGDGKVYRYCFQYKEWQKRSPAQFGHEKCLYGYGDNAKFFEELFGLLETKWPEVHQNILNKKISSDDEQVFASFFLAQCLRVPFSRDKLKGVLFDKKKQLLSDASSIEKIRADILRVEKIDLSEDFFFEVADKMSLENIARAEISRRSLADFLERTVKIASQMEWLFYLSDDKKPFVTSDCPCFIVAEDKTIRMPLGKNIFFVGREAKKSINYIHATIDDVVRMNKGVIQTAPSFIISSIKDFPANEFLSCPR